MPIVGLGEPGHDFQSYVCMEWPWPFCFELTAFQGGNMNYERPQLVDLDEWEGSVAAGANCEPTGSVAGTWCRAGGTAAVSKCNPGTIPV